ncbi:hypothetical protein LMH87_009316 [Akanthomyces muscarius]|uniref:AB hydrolase-1 domain-containing protein n=1 Tax=Akanthomyces muscarius TaxID=2231603 RepID=A0A9W8QDP0_AKAMU|nr:hypothetical protein LMH87_009316 [Akanthomyces muscarius]KAJ4152796.1 hypothetical protein LMH87_009316 [Akanthomyces muscarius]
MAPRSQKFNLGNDVAIHAIISSPPCRSAKPALVFLHYWGGSSRTWQWVVRHLSDEYQIVSLDFRGWGESSGPASEDAYSMSLLASDVEAVVEQLGLGDFTLIGLSMGAKVAQVVAARSPAGLRSIILLSPAPLSSCRLPPEMKDQQMTAYESIDTATFATLNVLTASSPAKDVVDVLVADQLRGNVWARAAWPRYGMEEDFAELTDAIRVPALVLAAEKDVVETPERVKKEVHDRIRESQWGLILGSGHLSPVDCAEEVANRIRCFV